MGETYMCLKKNVTTKSSRTSSMFGCLLEGRSNITLLANLLEVETLPFILRGKQPLHHPGCCQSGSRSFFDCSTTKSTMEVVVGLPAPPSFPLLQPLDPLRAASCENDRALCTCITSLLLLVASVDSGQHRSQITSELCLIMPQS